jgi:hypothetical protein
MNQPLALMQYADVAIELVAKAFFHGLLTIQGKEE